MAGKNQVTLTFAGDSTDLEKSFKSVGESARSVQDEVGKTSKAMKDSADGFDRAGEAADNVDTKAMGFRDTMTGVQDSMLGVSKIAKGDLFSGFFTLGMGIGDLGSGLYNFLIPSLKAAIPAMKSAALATKAFTLSLITNPIFLVATAIGLLVTGLVIAYKKSDDFRKVVDDVGSTLKTAFVSGLQAVIDIAKDFNNATADMTGGVSLFDAQLATSKIGVQASTAGLSYLSWAVKKLGGDHKEAAQQVSASDQLQKNYNTTQSIAKSRAERLSKAIQDQADYFDSLITKMHEASGQALTLSDSQIAYQQSVDDATQALKDNGRNININTQAGRDNRTALNNVARAANEQTEAVARSTGNLGAAAKTADRSKANFQRLAEKMGYSRAQAKALADKLIAIPNVNRTVTITMTKKNIEIVEKHYKNVIEGTYDYFGNRISGRASGGRTNPHTPYIVGERGPELWTPDTAGSITPNHMLGGGTGGKVQLEITFKGSMVQALRPEIQAKGGNVQKVLGAV